MPVADNLIIFLMIGLIIFFIYNGHIKASYANNHKDTSSRENFDNDTNHEQDKKSKYGRTKHYTHQNKTKHPDPGELCRRIQESQKSRKYSRNRSNPILDPGVPARLPETPVNSDFVAMQYHKDYNDTITAINNLTPQKELFNLGFLPVKHVIPEPSNIEELVELFMNKLNAEISNNVSEYLHVNSGWNDMGKRRREKSGFETQMEELGLPGSLYNEPATKARVKLVRLDKAEQFNTENQIRFIAYIIIQKENVHDQMVLKVQFFLERQNFKNGDDRAKFFERDLHENLNEIKNDQIVIIEQVFTVGYLTNDSKNKTKMDKFHDYGDVQRIDGTYDQENVLKVMLQKHKERADELNGWICTVDDDTKQIHNIPGIDSYSVYKNTRTIMDDLAKFPQRSFGDITI
jgi:hypothetical protein